MLEKLSYIGTSIAAVVAIIMLQQSLSDQANARKAELISDWQRAVVFEAIMLRKLSSYDEIEEHYLKRSQQVTNFELPSSQKTEEAITLVLATLAEQRVVSINKDNQYIPHHRIFVDTMHSYADRLIELNKDSQLTRNVAFSIAEILRKGGGEMRVSDLSKKISDKYPDISEAVLRRGYVQAVQRNLILVGGQVGQPKSAVHPPSFSPDGKIRLNPRLGYQQF
ncbi:hypothetical protein [Halomonas halmophila]|uniref:Uncharacterized protein n=1 Tax=Halomonas halmophila TaxID=252 RepID=A0A4Y4EWY6_9GAMM|nr:hypothetical protein [Halomonas halmophila]GED21626.1 hypothetical protein HHA01_06030 [Halomonas halmophila]